MCYVSWCTVRGRSFRSLIEMESSWEFYSWVFFPGLSSISHLLVIFKVFHIFKVECTLVTKKILLRPLLTYQYDLVVTTQTNDWINNICNVFKGTILRNVNYKNSARLLKIKRLVDSGSYEILYKIFSKLHNPTKSITKTIYFLVPLYLYTFQNV